AGTRKSHVRQKILSVELALPAGAGAEKLDAACFSLDDDLVDHRRSIPSSRAARFQAEVTDRCGSSLRRPLPAGGAVVAVKSAAETAAMSSSLLEDALAEAGDASKRSRKPVSIRAATKSGCSRIRWNSGRLVLMPPTKYSLMARRMRARAEARSGACTISLESMGS